MLIPWISNTIHWRYFFLFPMCFLGIFVEIQIATVVWIVSSILLMGWCNWYFHYFCGEHDYLASFYFVMFSDFTLSPFLKGLPGDPGYPGEQGKNGEKVRISAFWHVLFYSYYQEDFPCWYWIITENIIISICIYAWLLYQFFPFIPCLLNFLALPYITVPMGKYMWLHFHYNVNASAANTCQHNF